MHPPLKTHSSSTSLGKVYTIEDGAAIDRFVQDHGLYDLLMEARQPLDDAFGEAPARKLRLLTDDEGFTSLFCIVLVTGEMQAARHALRAFDDRWWIERSAQAAGRLNFDFELL